MISLDKKNLPSYIYKINLATAIFFIAWFALCLPPSVIIGCIYGESIITYIVMASAFALFFIGFAILAIIDKKIQKRLCAELTAELEKEFCDMPFEEAERILKENGIITDEGFAVKRDCEFGKEVLPFEETLVAFQFLQLIGRVKINIALCTTEGDVAGIIRLDRATYNFLANKNINFEDDEVAFPFLLNNKKEFAKYVSKFIR